MSENPELNKDKAPTQRPDLLDIVKIDGRWAQVHHGGDTVRFLNDNDIAEIKWNDYELVKEFHRAVSLLESTKQATFTDQEIANIYWGGEEQQYPHLKKQVKVFGEYIKK